ncbi:hypothetical protein GH714_002710 [Hevea brasiliensis]|uniref:Thaumatin-like protein n=1 Tax=Hevea brasiliensis TaxID=3981 RepID=A0A6A6LCE9_HEVBR|nr:hypothetical protein GH714_002710 [Hevea brasiliensis]
MSNFNIFLISIFLLSALFFTSSDGATFTIRNNCPYTVWAAASPGGGRRLDQGQTWELNVPAGTSMARIWGRTNCNFDGSGKGHCQTGDCGGILACQGWGVPPNTLAEYALNQYGNLDFYDISLVDGFNIPIEFSPTSGAKDKCRPLFCTADINGQCPKELKAPGGVTIHAQFLRPTNIVVLKGMEAVDLPNSQSFSKADAVMLIVTLRMILQAHMPWRDKLQGCVLPCEISSFPLGNGQGEKNIWANNPSVDGLMCALTWHYFDDVVLAWRHFDGMALMCNQHATSNTMLTSACHVIAINNVTQLFLDLLTAQ